MGKNYAKKYFSRKGAKDAAKGRSIAEFGMRIEKD
jgi:hypothetical protein